MPSSQTMIKQPMINYLLQIMFISILLIIYNLIGIVNPLLFSALTYLVIAFGIKAVILIYYKKGMIYYKDEEYGKAIQEFQKSFDLLMKHRWIDTYRYVAMLSSQIPYLEMTSLNMAFCYRQIGDRTKAKELYIKTLSLFPDCEMAKDELKILDSIKAKDELKI